MLKIRVIPILTFNGFALVKTKQFANPRMVGNPIQAARVYNSRGVDELVFLDIYATSQDRSINLKLVGDIIKECFMPVSIGGGIKTLDNINDLLGIGADKVIIKSVAIENPQFVKEASNFFGAQCISVAVDAVKSSDGYFIYDGTGKKAIELLEFVRSIEGLGAGEIILNSVDNDGMMEGFDIDLYNTVSKTSKLPIVMVGGGGNMDHFRDLFKNTDCEAVGSSSIFHFTQFTPLDIKNTISALGKPVRF